MSNDVVEPLTPKGSSANPILRKCRTVSKSNPSLIIGLPWEITAMSQLKDKDEFKIYIDFPNTNKIVLEKI